MSDRILSEAQSSFRDPRPVSFGITLPFNDHQVDYETFLNLSRLSEQKGFDSVWMADHLTGPTPFGATRWFDIVTLLSNLAGHVPRIRLGTDIIVAAYRHPVLAAKMLMTLDVVSGGRLSIGIGTGYIEKEFSEVGAPYAERGNYTSECVKVWKEMWSPGPANFEGEFFALQDTVAEPKPFQFPHPPLQFGGTAPGVLRRLVELGNGWHPLGLDEPQLVEKLKIIYDLAKASGRTDPITLTYSGYFGLVTKGPNTASERPFLTGGIDQVLDDISKLWELGFTEFLFRPGLMELNNSDVLEQVAFIGEELLPRIGDQC